jgi:hypothetical protein
MSRPSAQNDTLGAEQGGPLRKDAHGKPEGRCYAQHHGQAQSFIMGERYKNAEWRRDLGAR